MSMRRYLRFQSEYWSWYHTHGVSAEAPTYNYEHQHSQPSNAIDRYAHDGGVTSKIRLERTGDTVLCSPLPPVDRTLAAGPYTFMIRGAYETNFITRTRTHATITRPRRWSPMWRRRSIALVQFRRITMNKATRCSTDRRGAVRAPSRG